MECEYVRLVAVEKHARLCDQCRRKPSGAGCLEDVNEPMFFSLLNGDLSFLSKLPMEYALKLYSLIYTSGKDCTVK